MNSGTRIGPFEIVRLLGKGGMGEVFLATDTRLDRKVAIKILPAELSHNSSHKHRFEREAKTISNLSHPHICALHDVGHEDGIDYLVMEFLEGQTLAERLNKGPLPIEEVLRYALQICEALDKAHRQGVVHRDLKPGNIMLTKHGVKLLDFGLAKWMPHGAAPVDPAATLEVTVKESITEQGTILGTVQYMAPEQLEGKEADARTDIFAFGAVLYEMASGKKAFSGKSRASLMAAILEREPDRLSQIALLIPPALDRLVAGCLAKDPEERWQTAHDLKLQLKWILEGGSEIGVPKPVAARRRYRELVAWTLATALAIGFSFAVFIAFRSDLAPVKLSRFEIPPPAGQAIDFVALSPSGRKLAIVTVDHRENRQLWIRSLDSFTALPVSKSEGAEFPFWSPDERAVAFFADGNLKKLDLNSNVIVPLCKVRYGRGGSWSSKGVIIFSPDRIGPLYRVQATGGEAVPVTETRESHTIGDRWPWFLPDGEHFLFWAETEPTEEGRSGSVFVGSLSSPKQPRLLVSNADNAVYASGHLVYGKGGTIMAAPFDPESQTVAGTAFPVAEEVETVLYGADVGIFSVSLDGTLVYLPRVGGRTSQLVWYNLDGTEAEILGATAPYRNIHISPDGNSVSVGIANPTSRTSDLWIFDTDRKSSIRITTHPRDEDSAVWSPDGRWIIFTARQKKFRDLFRKEVGSIQAESLLWESFENKYPHSWSADGKRLLFTSYSLKTKSDLWVLHLEQDPPTAVLFLQTEFDDGPARFSPDGNWIAYVSTEQRLPEVFAISYPDRRGIVKISVNGGTNPRWSPDGTKIYYQDVDNYLVEVSVRFGPAQLVASAPKRLFQIRPAAELETFDVAPDGKRFLVNEAITMTNTAPLKVVLNWPLEFQKK